MVHDAGLPGDVFRHSDALVFRLVGQHRAGHAIADGPDVGDLGTEIMIDFDLAAVVGGKVDGFEAEPFGVRPAPDGNQRGIHRHRLGLTAIGGFEREFDPLALDGCGGDLGLELQGHALFLEDLGRFLAHIAVHSRQQLVEELHHGDVRTQAVPHAAKLQPDHAAADDDHGLGHFWKLERPGGIHDPPALVVDIDIGQRRDGGAGGDDDVLRRNRLVPDLHRMRVLEGGMALLPIHLVLLEQEFDPASQLADRLGLFRHHGVEVELHLAGLDAPFGHVAIGFVEEFGPVQQRLGGYAADIEAGAAQRLPAFGASGLQAKLRGANGGDVAARAGADDKDVVIVFVVSHHPTLVGRGFVSYKSISIRVGSSIASLMILSAVTASRPSIRRWS